jgi:hypothetical protein
MHVTDFCFYFPCLFFYYTIQLQAKVKTTVAPVAVDINHDDMDIVGEVNDDNKTEDIIQVDDTTATVQTNSIKIADVQVSNDNVVECDAGFEDIQDDGNAPCEATATSPEMTIGMLHTIRIIQTFFSDQYKIY